MSNLALVYGGTWGNTGITTGIDYVRPIPGATHHWAIDQYPDGPLRTWRDRVGTTNLNAPTADSQRPEVTTTGSSKQLVCNGINQRMDVAHPQPGVSTMLVVARLTSAPPSTYLLTGGTGPSYNLYIRGDSKWAFYAGASLSSTKDGDTNWHVFIVVYDGTSSVLNIDGTEWAGNAGTNTPTELRLAATSSAYTGAEFKAIAFLPYAADAAERARLSTQLRDTYGI